MYLGIYDVPGRWGVCSGFGGYQGRRYNSLWASPASAAGKQADLFAKDRGEERDAPHFLGSRGIDLRGRTTISIPKTGGWRYSIRESDPNPDFVTG